MNKRFSLCIVGCGSYAHVVMQYVGDMTDEIDFSFASRDIDKAKEYRDRYGGSAYYGSYEDAASDPRVDAMYFITPHDLHLENARLAAKHGKHVFMEKPIARTVDESRKLIDITKEAGVTLMVGENFRFDPATEKAKKLIADGAIGGLSLIDIQSENLDDGCVGWRLSLERCGGGRMIDGGIHYVDVLRNLAGSPESVYALAPVPQDDSRPRGRGQHGPYGFLPRRRDRFPSIRRLDAPRFKARGPPDRHQGSNSATKYSAAMSPSRPRRERTLLSGRAGDPRHEGNDARLHRGSRRGARTD